MVAAIRIFVVLYTDMWRLGNSLKDHKNQPKVAQAIGDQLREGDSSIVGVMIESHLIEGNQKTNGVDGPTALKKGISITDACIGWETTVEVLDQLADAVRTRRQVHATQNGSSDAADSLDGVH